MILVHRIGAVVTAAVLAIFGAVGLAGGLAFFSTAGRPVLGLSSNGLLSAVSLTTAAVLATSRGQFALAIAFGLVLLAIAFAVNLLVTLAQQRDARSSPL